MTTVPEGFELDADGTVDTGLDLQDEVNGAMESPAHCADLDATSWIQTSGMSGVSFAQSDYVDGDDQEIAQEVDSFDSAEHASRALAQLTAFMKTCTTFRDADSTRYDLSVSAAPGLGQGAVEGVISSPRIEGGVVEVAAVSGTEVITVLYSARKLSTARHAVGIASGIRGNLGA